MIEVLSEQRVVAAKRAFSTRRVRSGDMQTILRGPDITPTSGDLVLARVDEIGKHTKLELTSGRRASMFPRDEIIVAFGNRYAPDQFEAVIGPDLSPCDLVAAGGIASIEISRNMRMVQPTRITPIGLIGDAQGQRLNLSDYKVDAPASKPRIPAILSLGTSMNAGKSLTAASMVRGLKLLGYKVAALKITGTGSGGDVWLVQDAGADVTADFTDAGFASTYLADVEDIEKGAYRLMNHAADAGCELAVIEIADGLQQSETRALIRSPRILDVTLGTMFAAFDSMGAAQGVDTLRAAGHRLLALSGRIGRAPLAVREAEEATGLRYLSPWDLQYGAVVPLIRELAARRYRENDALAPLAKRFALEIYTQEALMKPLSHGDAADSAPDRAVKTRATRKDLETARTILVTVANRIMEAEIARLCDAPFGSRQSGRKNRRNGYRTHPWQTGVGALRLSVPRLRSGSYLPGFLKRPITAEVLFDLIDATGRPDFDVRLDDVLASLGTTDLDAEEIEALSENLCGLLSDRPTFDTREPLDSVDPELRNLFDAPSEETLVTASNGYLSLVTQEESEEQDLAPCFSVTHVASDDTPDLAGLDYTLSPFAAAQDPHLEATLSARKRNQG